MGNANSNSNATTNNIYDYSKVELPKNHNIIKIVNLSLNLKKGFSLAKSINIIVDYLFEDLNNKKADIITIQGLNDKYAVHEFISKFKNINKEKKRSYTTIPEFEDTDISMSENNTSIQKSIEQSWDSTSGENNITKKHSNLIISRLPIKKSSSIILNDSNGGIIKEENLIIANLDIDGKTIAFYNFSLTPDMLYVDTKGIRKIQLEIIIDNIKKNKEENNIKDHIISANFNIPLLKDNSVNDEYTEIQKKYKLFDLDLGEYEKNFHNKIIYTCLYTNGYDIENKKLNEIKKDIRKKYGVSTLQSVFNCNIDVVDANANISYLLINKTKL